MNAPSRRQFLASSAVAAGAASLPRIATANHETTERLKGQAEHVISIWLGGGMGQIDTFDPKAKGDPKTKKPGGYYDVMDTAVNGVQVCEHLSKTARLMDRVTAVRTVNHDVIDEHAAATNRMHTGRAISGTVTYPSLGALVAHERGAVNEDAPPYVLIGYPNVTRGPGFLGSKHGYLYLTETGRAPAGLSRPDGISNDRQTRREQFLATLKSSRGQSKISKFLDYESAMEQSMKLSGPDFTRVFQLDGEPDDLRNRYGGEFGQRCLLSRRLVESGVRFIEVSHNLNFLNGSGWDVHNSGIVNQHKLIQEMDTAVSSLIIDLEEKKLLDKTLIVITSEFGRPPEFDSGGGRGHQGSAFSCVLAGGGLSHCGAYGETDELAKKIVSDPVGVPDFFATICAALGIDYSKNLYAGDRPVPLTDQGQPIAKLFAS
ncbi:MAG: DUF1501 domain-containing protein [Rhodopirellula sp. JB055]|uniref:DUF1501 domain-containing protein n=1 Tax=Rhodopirellula sp. JB055 TaxID=3342846 RepID=UPI003709FC32